MIPCSGSVILLGKGCGVPFEWAPLVMRVIRVQEPPAYADNTWIDGYVLDQRGHPFDRRSVYPIIAGIQAAPHPAIQVPQRHLPRAAARNAGHRPVPRPRTPTETLRRTR